MKLGERRRGREWTGAVASSWATTPAGRLTVLILGTFLVRLIFAAALGLGIDESYMVAAGRQPQLSYFDHPPLAWWLAWAATHLAGSEAAIVVRLPFIVLFALTTGLMYRLTAALWGARAGLWAAVVLNLIPVLSVTAGSWVLPDGPLMAALLGAALCLILALPANGRAGWGWWLGAGTCAGLALMSKYSAILTLCGAFIFLLSEPGGRRWLRRPQPWVAALVAGFLFAPVLVWNARHGWISFRFQGARAAQGFHPLGPLLTTAGGALYLLPWVWLPLLLCGWHALRRGPRDEGRWLLLCLAAPPIVFFTVVSLWSRVLFHWAAPGYLMLVPLLGEAIARRNGHRRWIAATAALVLFGMALVASEVRLDWLPPIGGRDPALAAVDWTSLRADLAARGLLDRPGLVVAATRWLDAGKIDYALGGRLPVVCLGDDPREYGLIAPVARYAGRDVLIVAPKVAPAEIAASYGRLFASIETLAPSSVRHDGRAALPLPLYLGRHLHSPPDGASAGIAGSR